METVEIKKDVLIEKIKTNLETHQTTYDKAVEVFSREQTKLLGEMLVAARNGKNFDRLALSRMLVPENHAQDYRVALEMLELDQRDVIPLDQGDFRRYVRDEWEWQRAWLANTASYSMQG